MPVRLVKAPVWRTGASTGPACAVPMAERQGRCATAGRAVRAQREGFRGKTAYLPHRQQGQPRLSTHTEPCHTPRRAYPDLFILNTAVSVWLWHIRIKTRPKHYQDVLFSQNEPQNLNLTQKFGLEKSLSGFFRSWSLHIYHIYIYISKK